MPLLSVNVRSLYDPRPVLRAVERAERRVLGHQGGYLRKVARSSIKRKGWSRLKKGERPGNLKGAAARLVVSLQFAQKSQLTRRERNIMAEIQEQPAAPAGQPPFTHSGFIKEDIVYAVDPGRKSVAIGPYREPWLNELMEYSGTSRKNVWLNRRSGQVFLFHRGPSGSLRARKRNWKHLRTITVRHEARPFMRRAYEKSEDRLAGFWAGAVRP